MVVLFLKAPLKQEERPYFLNGILVKTLDRILHNDHHNNSRMIHILTMKIDKLPLWEVLFWGYKIKKRSTMLSRKIGEIKMRHFSFSQRNSHQEIKP